MIYALQHPLRSFNRQALNLYDFFSRSALQHFRRLGSDIGQLLGWNVEISESKKSWVVLDDLNDWEQWVPLARELRDRTRVQGGDVRYILPVDKLLRRSQEQELEELIGSDEFYSWGCYRGKVLEAFPGADPLGHADEESPIEVEGEYDLLVLDLSEGQDVLYTDVSAEFLLPAFQGRAPERPLLIFSDIGFGSLTIPAKDLARAGVHLFANSLTHRPEPLIPDCNRLILPSTYPRTWDRYQEIGHYYEKEVVADYRHLGKES